MAKRPVPKYDFKAFGAAIKVLGGELRETQTANYFSNFSPVDCAVPSANA